LDWASHTQSFVLQHAQWRKQKPHPEAKKFSDRIKRHLGRRFVKRKQQFHRHQIQVDRQRRLNRARLKARQFAAARRHAAQHAHKPRHASAPKPKKLGFRKFRHLGRPGVQPNAGSSSRHWRSLWRRGARNPAHRPED
jgi:hypothetical protein